MVRVLAWLVLLVQKREGLAGGLRGTRLCLFGRTRGGLRRLQSRLRSSKVSLLAAHGFGGLLHRCHKRALYYLRRQQAKELLDLCLFVGGEGEQAFQNFDVTRKHLARELNDGLAARNFVRSGRSSGRFRLGGKINGKEFLHRTICATHLGDAVLFQRAAEALVFAATLMLLFLPQFV